MSGHGSPSGAEPVTTAGHETEDLRAGVLSKLVLLLGAVAACMVFAMIGLRIWVTRVQTDSRPALTRLQTTAINPPKPNLQSDPVAELAQLHAREASALSGYAYLDPAKTRARIPIEQAMTLMVGRDMGPPP